MRHVAWCFALALAAPAFAQPADAPVTASLIGPVLNIVNIDKEVDFYVRAFGMTQAMTLDAGTKREYFLRFGSDASQSGIILVRDMAASAPKTISHGTAFNRIVLRVSDLDAVAKRLDAASFAHSAIRDVAKGYRMMMLNDPEGYHIEAVQIARPVAK